VYSRRRVTRRARILVIVALLALCVVGYLVQKAGKEESYAYVTHVDPTWDGQRNRCNVVAQLPLKNLDHEPSGANPELLKDATLVRSRERDWQLNCSSALHTWLPVRFSSQDRTKVSFDLRESSFEKYGLFGLIGLLVLWSLLGERVMRRYRAGRDRRHERAHERRQAAIRDIGKRPLPTMRVVGGKMTEEPPSHAPEDSKTDP
jgi:hypothetical protein